MGKRYTITKGFVFEDCLVAPSVYEGGCWSDLMILLSRLSAIM